MSYIKTYAVTFIVFFVLDILWLGLVAKNYYREQLGHLMAENTNWLAAVIFYSIFITGLIYFAVNPALAQDNWMLALKVGALFGFMCYATYDMTNLSTLKDWPLTVTLIDIFWGTTLNGLTATISFFIIRWLS